MNKYRPKIERMSHGKILILLISILFSTTSIAQTLDQLAKKVVNNKEFYVYEVPAAEGFYSLTRKFNISQEEIEKYNPETKNGLKLGQRLLIPTQPTTRPTEKTSTHYFTHTVARGETLHRIAQMYHVSVAQVKALNPSLGEILPVGFSVRIPQQTKTTNNEGGYVYITIEPKDTLYGIARKYGVSMQDILDENPGLTSLNFSIGRIIRLKPGSTTTKQEKTTPEEPTFDLMEYKVKRKENFMTIAQKFNIKESALRKYNPGVERLRSGKTIFVPIPRKKQEPTAVQESKVDSIQHMHDILQNTAKIDHNKQARIALLLPFDLNKRDANSIKNNKYLEFYEGFLIAIDSIRKGGTSVQLHVFDTATKSIAQILGTPEMQDVNLIVGPATDYKIKQVAQFAKHKEINMVNPFTFDAQATETNPYLFQLNTPTSFLNAETTDEFIKLFKDHQIVFLKQTGLKTDKKELMNYLRHELSLQEIPFNDYEYSTTEQLTYVDSLLNLNGPTVFVPLSAKKEALNNILPSLTVVKRNNDSINVSLFGYPEWQMYTNEYMDYYYSLNTYIYTRIYTNPFAPETNNFYNKYKNWYQKELLPIYPKYGVLGYDTGMFFLNALKRYGKNFDAHIEMTSAQSVQTAMYFKRINNWGGFVNRSIYFVNFRPNGTINKIEVK